MSVVGVSQLSSFWATCLIYPISCSARVLNLATYRNVEKAKADDNYFSRLDRTHNQRTIISSVLHELNEKVQFSSKVRFLVNFELNLVHFSKKELELN